MYYQASIGKNKWFIAVFMLHLLLVFLPIGYLAYQWFVLDAKIGRTAQWVLVSTLGLGFLLLLWIYLRLNNAKRSLRLLASSRDAANVERGNWARSISLVLDLQRAPGEQLCQTLEGQLSEMGIEALGMASFHSPGKPVLHSGAITPGQTKAVNANLYYTQQGSAQKALGEAFRKVMPNKPFDLLEWEGGDYGTIWVWASPATAPTEARPPHFLAWAELAGNRLAQHLSHKQAKRQMEDTLQERAYLSQTFDGGSDAMAIYTYLPQKPDTLSKFAQLVRTNHAFKKSFPSFSGRLDTLLPPHVLQPLLTEGGAPQETELLVEGQVAFYHAYWHAFTDEQGKNFAYLQLKNITSWKKQELFQLGMQKASAQQQWVIDQEGIIRYASPSSMQAPAIAADGFTDKAVSALLHPDDASRLEQHLRSSDKPKENGPQILPNIRMAAEDGRWLLADAILSHIADTETCLLELWTNDHRRSLQLKAEQTAAFFISVIENCGRSMAVVNTDKQISYESPLMAQLFGYSAPERLGRFALEYIHEEDLPAAEQALDDALQTGQASQAIYRFLDADRQWRKVRMHFGECKAPQTGEGALMVMEDITAEATAMAQMQLTAQRLQLLAANHQIYTWGFDTQGVIQEGNDAFVKLVPKPSGGRWLINQCLHQDDHDIFWSAVKQLEAGQAQTEALQLRLCYKDRQTITTIGWIVAEPNRQRFFVLAANAENQQANLIRLQQEKTLFEELVQSTTTLLFSVGKEGTVGWANRTTKKTLGYEPQGKFMQWVHSEDVPRIEALLAQTDDLKEAVATECRLMNQEGEWLSFRCVAQPFAFSDKKAYLLELVPAKKQFVHLSETTPEAVVAAGMALQKETAILLTNAQLDITHAMGNATKLLGHSTNDLKGKKLQELLLPSSIGQVTAAVKNLVKGISEHQELTVATHNNSGEEVVCQLHLSKPGLADKLVLCFQNLTQLAKETVLLAKARDQWQWMANITEQPIALLNDGRFIYLNTAFTHHFGHLVYKPLTPNWSNLLPENMRKELIDAQSGQQKKGTLLGFQATIQTAKGAKKMYVALLASPRANWAGVQALVLHDLSQIEAKEAAHEADLAQAQKLADKKLSQQREASLAEKQQLQELLKAVEAEAKAACQKLEAEIADAIDKLAKLQEERTTYSESFGLMLDLLAETDQQGLLQRAWWLVQPGISGAIREGGASDKPLDDTLVASLRFLAYLSANEAPKEGEQSQINTPAEKVFQFFAQYAHRDHRFIIDLGEDCWVGLSPKEMRYLLFQLLWLGHQQAGQHKEISLRSNKNASETCLELQFEPRHQTLAEEFNKLLIAPKPNALPPFASDALMLRAFCKKKQLHLSINTVNTNELEVKIKFPTKLDL